MKLITFLETVLAGLRSPLADIDIDSGVNSPREITLHLNNGLTCHGPSEVLPSLVIFPRGVEVSRPETEKDPAPVQTAEPVATPILLNPDDAGTFTPPEVVDEHEPSEPVPVETAEPAAGSIPADVTQPESPAEATPVPSPDPVPDAPSESTTSDSGSAGSDSDSGTSDGGSAGSDGGGSDGGSAGE